mgnify:CR=1 FL=1|jgi:hypothetical protein
MSSFPAIGPLGPLGPETAKFPFQLTPGDARLNARIDDLEKNMRDRIHAIEMANEAHIATLQARIIALEKALKDHVDAPTY